MRIAELSRASGVPIPTIKYYLREGLLPTGQVTAPNQADYSDRHVRRLRLIRALAEIGRLNLRAVRKILDAVDDEALTTHELRGIAHYELGHVPESPHPDPDMAAARVEVDQMIAELGWLVEPEAPGRRALAQALVTLRQLGRAADVSVFKPYARVAERLAAWELRKVAARRSRTEAVESVVAGIVVFEAALVALRRLAQEHHSALLAEPPAPPRRPRRRSRSSA
jgi:DNA-binding transcriptional MerR regulator